MPHDTQALNRVRDHRKSRFSDLNGFNYSAPAELFPSRIKKGKGRITYKRFDTAAEALALRWRKFRRRCCSVPASRSTRRSSAWHEIRYLYDSAAYPLKRGTPAN